MGRTGFFSHAVCLRHDTGPGHPERAERLRAIEARLKSCGLWSELDVAEAPLLEVARTASIHDADYVARVRARIESGERVVDEGDTKVSSESWRAALAAAGGAIEAVAQVLDGRLDHAFVAARPPGHHAERDRAMGFCVLNNAALAAQHLRVAHGLERVAILDWDVHHGNGTQHIFEHDPRVFYASLHQYPLYPGTGAARERGIGAGEGTTLNVPLPPASGDQEWLGALEDTVLPALEAFAPEFLIISAGFDAHRDDPLSQTRLSTDAYRRMTESCVELARRTCASRVVSLLEGGYDLEALGESVAAHLGALCAARLER